MLEVGNVGTQAQIKVSVSVRPAPDSKERVRRLSELLLGPGEHRVEEEDNRNRDGELTSKK